MQDERWEPDTLFLVFEEDFRFSPHDEPEPVVIKASGLQEVVGEPNDATSPTEKTPIGASNSVTQPLIFCFYSKQQTTCMTVEPTATVTEFCATLISRMKTDSVANKETIHTHADRV